MTSGCGSVPLVTEIVVSTGTAFKKFDTPRRQKHSSIIIIFLGRHEIDFSRHAN